MCRSNSITCLGKYPWTVKLLRDSKVTSDHAGALQFSGSIRSNDEAEYWAEVVLRHGSKGLKALIKRNIHQIQSGISLVQCTHK